MKKQNGFVDEMLLFENATPQSCSDFASGKPKKTASTIKESFSESKNSLQGLLVALPFPGLSGCRDVPNCGWQGCISDLDWKPFRPPT